MSELIKEYAIYVIQFSSGQYLAESKSGRVDSLDKAKQWQRKSAAVDFIKSSYNSSAGIEIVTLIKKVTYEFKGKSYEKA